jgi:hypothetical protein
VSRPIKAFGETTRSMRIAFPSCEKVTSSPGVRFTAFRKAAGITTCPSRPMRWVISNDTVFLKLVP